LMKLLNLLHGCHHLEAALLNAGTSRLMKDRHLMASSHCVLSKFYIFCSYVISVICVF